MQKVLLCVALVAVVAVAAEFYPARDVSVEGLGAMRDGSMELAGDTPMRQAQRARHAERGNDFGSAEGVSLVETGAQRLHDPNGPALNRLTGASKTFHPNDQMCVMCQYLVQRTQLDMAHFNVLGGFQKIKAAGAGGAGNAAAGGADAGEKSAGDESSFLQIASSFAADESSQDWADEDAEEAAAMEIAAKQELAEADGDWTAVAALEAKSHAIDTVVEEIDAQDAAMDEDEDAHELEEGEEVAVGEEFEEEADEEHAVAHELAATSFAETDNRVLTEGLTAEEQREMADVMTEIRNDQVQQSIDQQLADGMASTPVLVETESAAKHESEDEGEAEAEAEDESEMHADEVEVTRDMVANSDRDEFVDALGESFDSELNLSADERQDMASLLNKDSAADPSWGSPAYNADGRADADTEVVTTEALDADSNEDLALLQVDATDSDSDEDESDSDNENENEQRNAEAEADAAQDEEMEGIADGVELVETASNAAAPRAYARVLHVAEEEPVQPMMAEVSGQHASFQSAGGLAAVDRRCSLRLQKLKRCKRVHGTTKKRCLLIKRKIAPPTCTYGKKTIGISNSPRRFRLADAIASRPRWNRWDPTVKPHPDANRAKAREMWHHLMQMTYDRLEGYCSTRLPEQFTPFCRPLLRRFRVVAEGIRYGDRPNQICMRTRFCPRGSYVRRSPHNVFKHMEVCRGPTCADLGVPIN